MARRGSVGPTPTERRMEKLLAAQERSGLTLAEFARRRGVPDGRLRWWKHELGRRRAARGSEGPVQFVPLQVTGRPSVALAPRDGVMVELPRGIRIHVPPGTSGEELREILEAVRRSC